MRFKKKKKTISFFFLKLSVIEYKVNKKKHLLGKGIQHYELICFIVESVWGIIVSHEFFQFTLKKQFLKYLSIIEQYKSVCSFTKRWQEISLTPIIYSLKTLDDWIKNIMEYFNITDSVRLLGITITNHCRYTDIYILNI